VFSFPNIAGASDILRYQFGFVMALQPLFLALALKKLNLKNLKENLLQAGVAFFYFYILGVNSGWFINAYLNVKDYKVFSPLSAYSHAEDLRTLYHDFQEKIPEHAIILSAVTHPYLFDFHRNPIFLLDIPGNVWPLRPFPTWSESSEVLTDLRKCGIGYFAFIDPAFNENYLYSPPFWKGPDGKNTGYLQNWAPQFQSYFDFLRNLKETSERPAQGIEPLILHKVSAGN
jgi:hypothetical protein